MTITAFISYSHKDHRYRKQLEAHLGNLRNQQIIQTWYDGDIVPGTEWEPQIMEQLNTAQIILLLISADFLTSPFCYSIELKQAIARHDAHQARVLPILLRSLDWKGAPFAKLNMLPSGGKPITTWKRQDDAFADIAKGIRRAIEELQTGRTSHVLVPSSTPVLVTPQEETQAQLWNTPPRNPFFTGREELLDHLHHILTMNQTTTLTQPPAISGLGGIGKTQTALEYIYRYHNNYQQVFWVKADTREELVTDLVAVARHLHLPQQYEQDQNIILAATKLWLETHTDWLLVLDNADDLKMISPYLPAGRTGHILLTTRAQTMGGIAQKVNVTTMGKEEGALFLLRRASHIPPQGSLADAQETDVEQAQEIVKNMDGLPLALDQAGAYIEETQCTFATYLSLYRSTADQRRKLLHYRNEIIPSHPAAVAATWSISFEKVKQTNPAAADLLRLCAFLAPDAIPELLFTEGAKELGPVLAPVAANPLALNTAIGALLAYSFVRRDPATQTLAVHRLVQAVLKDEMDKKMQRQWAERTVKAVNKAFPVVEGTTQAVCQVLLPHAQICFLLIREWNFTTSEAARLLDQAGYYLEFRGQYEQAEPLYTYAIATRKKVLGPEHPDTAASLARLGWLHYLQGQYEKAESVSQRALAIREKVLGPEHPDTKNARYYTDLLKSMNRKRKE